jgi:sirohydrochlorin ferrochelatase
MQPLPERIPRLFHELANAWSASARCEEGLCGCGEDRACAYRRGYRNALLRAYVLATGEHPGQVRRQLQDLYLASDPGISVIPERPFPTGPTLVVR